MENIGEKIYPDPQIFILPNNWEEKREREAQLWNYIFTPLQVDVLYVGFFPFLFLFIYFIMGTCVLVSQVLDSLSFLPFFFLFFFNSFLLCLYYTLSFFNCFGFFFFFLKKKSFGFFKFLSSFYFIFLMKKSFIHIFF